MPLQKNFLHRCSFSMVWKASLIWSWSWNSLMPLQNQTVRFWNDVWLFSFPFSTVLFLIYPIIMNSYNLVAFILTGKPSVSGSYSGIIHWPINMVYLISLNSLSYYMISLLSLRNSQSSYSGIETFFLLHIKFLNCRTWWAKKLMCWTLMGML